MKTDSPVRAYQWNLILVVAAMFVVWELLEHWLLMRLPMRWYHVADVVGSTLWLALATTIIFNMIARYEQQLQNLNVQLQAQNEQLEAVEETRDKRLVELSRELSFTLAELTGQAQVALQTTTDLPNIRALSAALDRADELQKIAHDLLDLKHLTDGFEHAAPHAPHESTAGESTSGESTSGQSRSGESTLAADRAGESTSQR